MCEYRSYRFAAICRWVRILHLQHERLYDMNYLKTADCLMHVKLLKKTVNGWNECLLGMLLCGGAGFVQVWTGGCLICSQMLSEQRGDEPNRLLNVGSFITFRLESADWNAPHALTENDEKKPQSSAGLLFQTNSPCLEIQVSRPSMKTPWGSI